MQSCILEAHMFMFANSALLRGGVRVWIREQRSKGDQWQYYGKLGHCLLELICPSLRMTIYIDQHYIWSYDSYM